MRASSRRLGTSLFAAAIVIAGLLAAAWQWRARVDAEVLAARLFEGLERRLDALEAGLAGQAEDLVAAAEARSHERQTAELNAVLGAPERDSVLRRYLDERERQGAARRQAKARAVGEEVLAERREVLEATLAAERRRAAEIVHGAGAPPWAPPILLSGAALLALWGAAQWFHRRRVARPLAALAGVMDEVAVGATRRIPTAGDREVQRTQEAFNRMADALGAVRRDLEARVDQKTAALAGALTEQREQSERLRRVLDDLRSAQERLIRQEKMAALGTLAGGVAHEFNNLLGGIRGCAEEALEEAADPELRQSLEVIAGAARRGRAIVDGLLRFSRGAARRPEIVDLGAAVEEVRRLLARAAAERQVTLRATATEPVSVLADPAEVHQVLVNLVQNALQVSPAGAEVEVALMRDARRVRLEVRDRGPGISAEVAPRIFEPFFTTRGREGGTGLGLAISHGIVQGLGGALSFRSREGGGTVFVADLPVAAPGSHDS